MSLNWSMWLPLQLHPNESMSKEPPSPSFWGQALICWFFLCCLTRRWIRAWTNHSQRGNLHSRNIMAMHHRSIYIHPAGSNRHISWSYVFHAIYLLGFLKFWTWPRNLEVHKTSILLWGKKCRSKKPGRWTIGAYTSWPPICLFDCCWDWLNH